MRQVSAARCLFQAEVQFWMHDMWFHLPAKCLAYKKPSYYDKSNAFCNMKYIYCRKMVPRDVRAEPPLPERDRMGCSFLSGHHRLWTWMPLDTFGNEAWELRKANLCKVTCKSSTKMFSIFRKIYISLGFRISLTWCLHEFKHCMMPNECNDMQLIYLVNIIGC